MSFLSRTTPIMRSAATLNARTNTARLFATTSIFHRTATEAVKDGLKTVDRTVSDIAVAGIDKGVELKDKAAEVAGIETGKAQEVAGEAKGKASELAGQAKGKASEVAGEAKGKAAEVQGKL